MDFDAFGYFCLQLFILPVVSATVFLVCFNVGLALLEQVGVMTNSLERRL